MRVIRVTVTQPGFRTRTLALVTTLLDPVAYPASEVSAAYLRRWRIELCLDDLKTVLGLEALRCKSPDLVQSELLALLVAHNLVRVVMAEASQARTVPLDRLSFTGTLASLRTFAVASAQAKTGAQRRTLWAALLARLAADLVPWRPGRHEPRAVKRRPKPYPYLNCPAISTGTSATAHISAAPPKLLKCHSYQNPVCEMAIMSDPDGNSLIIHRRKAP